MKQWRSAISDSGCDTLYRIASSPGGGGEDSAHERGGNARRTFWIKPLKETDLGLAQGFFDPYKRPCWNIDNI